MKIFCYSPKITVLHKLPALLKLVLIACLSYLVFQIDQSWMLLLGALLLLGKLYWRINGWRQLSVFFVSVFVLSGLFNINYGQFNLAQLLPPFFYTLPLVIVLLLNIFFVFSTTPYQIAHSVSQLFCFYKPWQKKIFLIVFLIFSLIPIIFHKSQQLKMAQESRIFHLNPLKRTIYKLFPLLIICLETADKLGTSLQSRL